MDSSSSEDVSPSSLVDTGRRVEKLSCGGYLHLKSGVVDADGEEDCGWR